ncbi:hypothetical protein M5D96_007634 [Drosophila gunungcola]|uniref:Uncharacterized protein n=1 Tax=Drosophila gunungcola TaxID=103775 RepID=A0A9Q0BP25_9MUSC|nr:hypothetical protein M5D96_007634 [Drosophila gunungcola]
MVEDTGFMVLLRRSQMSTVLRLSETRIVECVRLQRAQCTGERWCWRVTMGSRIPANQIRMHLLKMWRVI